VSLNAYVPILVEVIPGIGVIRIDVKHVWLGTLALEQNAVCVLGEEFGDLAVWIIDVTKNPGPALAGVDTGRFHPLGDPVQAEITLINRPGFRVQEAGIVGAGMDAVLAADANVFIDNDDTIFLAFVGGASRTDRYAGRFAAVVAKAREKGTIDIGVFPFFCVLHPATIASQRYIVLTLAGYGTCVASNTAPGIDYHGILNIT